MKLGTFIKYTAAAALSMGLLNTNALADTALTNATQNQTVDKKAAGEAFLLTNEPEAGVVTLPDSCNIKLLPKVQDHILQTRIL